MDKFLGEWQGAISGSNEGAIFIEIKDVNGQVTGDFTFIDRGMGLTVGKLTDMTTDGLNLVGRIVNIHAKSPTVPTQGVFSAHIIEDGNAFAGDWSTDIGTSGKIILYKLGLKPVTVEGIPPKEKSVFKINMRKARIGSCVLKLEDLKKFFKALQEKVDESYELEIKYYKSTFGKDNPQIKDAFKLAIQIFGSRGEYFFGLDESIFDNQNLPNNIETIIFDSFSPFEFRFHQKPQNGMRIHIKHLRTDMLDFGATMERNEFENFIEVSGNNETWVSAVFGYLQDFFKEKSVKRNWLHGKKAYDLLIWLVFWPLVLWLLFRTSKVIAAYLQNLPIIPSIAIYIYVAVISYYLFRLLLNYARWIFPLIELQLPKEDRRRKHRKFLWAILIGVISPILYDIGKYLVKLIRG